MRLNMFTDYGFRVLMRLANPPGEKLSSTQLAEEFRVSIHHLNKVIATMSKAGFVATQRGQHGGVRLARPASEITLGEVVRVMEKKTALVECFRANGGKCTFSNDCKLRDRLWSAQQKSLQALDKSTIADCVSRPEIV